MESFRGGLYCEQMNLEAILAEGIRGENPRVRGNLRGSCDRSPSEALMVPGPGRGLWR